MVKPNFFFGAGAKLFGSKKFFGARAGAYWLQIFLGEPEPELFGSNFFWWSQSLELIFMVVLFLIKDNRKVV